MNEENLVIQFQSESERILFMNWLKQKGIDDFSKHVSKEFGAEESHIIVTDEMEMDSALGMNYGFIEIE